MTTHNRLGPRYECPEFFDGLTAEQCLERYEQNMREGGPRFVLTPAQREAGQKAWSEKLRAKGAK